MSSSPPLVLVFAASDPTGGAGLQADLLTLASRGCHPLSAVTAITVQDTTGVEQIEAVDCDLVEKQARRLLEEMPVSAFKLGVLGSLRNIEAIARVAADYPHVPLILDPVLASGRGDPLSNREMVAALRELLVPRASVITPNSLEARQLAREHDTGPLGLEECARRLLSLGCGYVLVTGTHEADSEVVNTLYGPGGVVRTDRWPRLPGSYHGSGCTLASAVAAGIANGLALPQAVRDAQEFTWQALRGGFRPGKGQFLPDRFLRSREIEDAK
jgi:hydroxymethylpyrimidine/phosphomethylpyrimidine kinase